ncbi:MAG TPA: hypothetical protein VNM69_00570 [Bacillus sp. (in: firmicutes)]|uniref:hypothetical protein n=1 Tax=Bacillus litorisediminis TaxID=2922713 RepID=UPI001FABE186|nr:hypothetical protein [Bacillus litorisediminis]HWO74388.1 hypothetical protein [Bacillus sp. (in: firmicutes)]
MKNGDKRAMLMISIGIMIFLICIVIGLFFVPIKELLMKPEYGYFFGSSGQSYIAATVSIALLGISLMFLGWVTRKRKTKWIIFTTLFLISSIGIYYAIDDYYYIDPNGIVFDPLETTQEKVLKWEEISELTHIYRKDMNGTPVPAELIIKMQNGEEVIMILGARQYSMRSSINSTVRKFGGESYIEIYDPEGNFIERKEYF